MADALDLGVVLLLGAAMLLLAGMVRYLLIGPPFRLPALPPELSAPLGALLAVGYLAAGWATTGRTPGSSPRHDLATRRSCRPRDDRSSPFPGDDDASIWHAPCLWGGVALRRSGAG